MSLDSNYAMEVVAVAEAAEAIVVYAEAEDVGTAEEAVEGTEGCPITSTMRNGGISPRRRRRISTMLERRRRARSITIFHLQGPT